MARECSSFKFGGFTATCSEIEIVTGDSEIRICSEREDQHPELFHGAAGACGTIGVITLIKVRLMPAKPYLQLTLCYANSATEIHERTLKAMEDSNTTDSIETVLLSADETLLIFGYLIANPGVSRFRYLNASICQGLTPKNASATPRFRTASEPPPNRLRSSQTLAVLPNYL